MRLIIAAVIVLALGAAGYFLVFAPSDASESYRTGTVGRQDIVNSVSATGTLSAVVTVEVGSQISGQIQDVYVDFNAQVTAGQPIAQIDPATFEARVIQNEAELAIARANVTQQTAAIERSRADRDTAKAGLDEAARDLKRKRELQSSGNVSRSALDTATAVFEQADARFRSSEAQLKIAEAQLETAKAQVTQREAQLNSARVDFDRTTIRSPVDGVVINRNIDPGQTVAASLQAPILFEIAQDLREMQLEVVIDEADIGRVRESQAVSFTVDAYPTREFEGEVRQVRLAPRVVQNVVTYTVIVSADNPRRLLLPGMTANVEITDEIRENVLTVPSAALRFRPESETGGGETGGAGRPGGGGGPGGNPMAGLLDQLDLTPEQKAEADEIMGRMRQRMQGLMAGGGGGGDQDERRRAFGELREQMMKELNAILTEEQRQKLASLTEAAAARRGEGGEGEPRLRPGRVFVLDNGKPRAVPVLTGLSDGTVTEIQSDTLKEGDTVITGVALSAVAAPPAPPAGPGGRRGFGF
ncbi:MAG: efflux RND transporter periplasmic adaptor subunit [Alphaproteobacteria bacterium]|nr:efflux RND transporter periplasmic adaptor subunit [Alphaproteobacteria bacterium]